MQHCAFERLASALVSALLSLTLMVGASATQERLNKLVIHKIYCRFTVEEEKQIDGFSATNISNTTEATLSDLSLSRKTSSFVIIDLYRTLSHLMKINCNETAFDQLSVQLGVPACPHR